MPTADSPLAPIFDAFDADRATLAAAVARVPAPLRTVRPAPDRWSVAEIVEHLAIAQERMAGLLAQKGAAAPPRAGAVPAGTADYARAPLLDRGRRLIAPDFIQPSAALDADEAWAALARSTVALRATLEALDDRDLTGFGREHPALGTINGYQWIAAMGGHEARHAAQIDEIADDFAGRA